MVNALLAADKRKLSVRSKAECWFWILGEVVRNVTHTGLLVVTNDGAQGVRKLLAGLFNLLNKVVSSPKRESQRTLIVQNTTTQNEAFAAGNIKWIYGPTLAQGDNVGVSNGCKVFFGFTRKVTKS